MGATLISEPLSCPESIRAAPNSRWTTPCALSETSPQGGRVTSELIQSHSIDLVELS